MPLLSLQSEVEIQMPQNTVYYLSMGEGSVVDLSMARRFAFKACFFQHKKACSWTNEISCGRCWGLPCGIWYLCSQMNRNLKHFVKALLLILKKCRDFAAHSSIVVLFSFFFFNSYSLVNAAMIKMVMVPRDRAGGSLHLLLWSSDQPCASLFKDNNFHRD